jgi:hypothetical protein
MDWILLLGPALKLLFAVVAILVAWRLLLWLDNDSENPFPDDLERMRRDPRAVAVYRVGRLLALAVFLGLLLSG